MRNPGGFIGDVARELWGAPNERLSSARELRWGKNGGRMVRLDKGTWADHSGEHGSINSGGVVDLIAREIGSDTKGAYDWMEQRGYDVADDGAQPRANGNGHHAPKASRAPLGKEAEAYDYIDENGTLLFQVVRYEPKDFRQRRQDETGKWIAQVAGVRQVPYRLPELLEAISMGHPVYVVEGERDVHSLHELGITATSSAGGAGKWRPELCEFFRGADVIILQDNDPQATTSSGELRWHPDGRPVRPGPDHAQDVAKQLHGIAARVRVLDLAQHWPEMPAKGDISDWIANGGTAEALHALAEKQQDWTVTFRSRFGGMRWEDIGVSHGAVGYKWFVENIIPMGEISLVFGDSGTGKSFNMFDLAMAGARGIHWNGYNIEPGLVIYVAAEAGKGFSKRKIAYAIHHKLNPADPLPFYLLTKRPNFFNDDTDVQALVEEIKGIKASYSIPLVCVVIDTLSALAPGMNENASSDVSMVRKRLVMLQESFEAAIILVHHKPKGGSTPRGHSSLTADFETTIEFETRPEKNSTGKTIHRGTVRKQREDKSSAFWQFTLPVIEVGQNKWGNPETSCVVQPHVTSTVKGGGGFHATPTEMLMMHAMFDAMNNHPLPPPAGLPPSITKVVEQRYVQSYMKERMFDTEDGSDAAKTRFRVAFSRAGTKLLAAAVIGRQGNLMWVTGKPVNGFGGPVVGE